LDKTTSPPGCAKLNTENQAKKGTGSYYMLKPFLVPIFSIYKDLIAQLHFTIKLLMSK